jgi:hypothetical protein
VPVWCAADNGILLVFSEADSWKVKRIRRDAHVRLAPCSARGKPRGPAVDADASLALLQLGNALAVRSERESVLRLGLGSNRFLGWTVLGTLLVQLGLLYWPPAQTGLDLQPLALGDLAMVLVASTAAFWAIEAEKLIRRLRSPSPTKHR